MARDEVGETTKTKINKELTRQAIQIDKSEDVFKTEDRLTVFVTSMGLCEGFGVPGAIPTVNNNPINIRNSTVCEKFNGKDGRNGFCVFPSSTDGYEAAKYIVRKYHKDHTLLQTMNILSPPVENNTYKHTNCISKKSGIGFNDIIISS